MTPTQSVAEFAARARAWLADNMPSVDPMSPPAAPRDQERSWQRARELQKRLYEGGFAGICFPASTVARVYRMNTNGRSTRNPCATRCR
ncbi:acyl-CoA dehydrogenase middle domain protein [Mycobacterium kansasii]|uniref:Acyl-CoA dehydrogenase middle domain protein n=1 Tax=Mycobacterium kansasii TaxID=1768 RepID=A0A1V3XIT6_MYCKA|nr:acyl-CoA dehydrogenase middle domain protein [Mycobacterium kansasii]